MTIELRKAMDAAVERARVAPGTAAAAVASARRQRRRATVVASAASAVCVAAALLGTALISDGPLRADRVSVVDQPARMAPASPSPPNRSLTPAVQPPSAVTVEGVQFLRRDRREFVLRPGIRQGDALGVFVSVPETYVPDGQCAVHYEPVIAKQTAIAVTLATWRYTPRETPPELVCARGGYGDGTVRLQLDEPLGQRTLLIAGRQGPSRVLLLQAGSNGGPIPFNMTPASPDAAQICLQDRCVTVTDQALLTMSAAALNRALQVRPGDECSDAGRTDNVNRTYQVRFGNAGDIGPRVQVPLGCSTLRVVGDDREFALESGGPDVVRIAFDQQISPDNDCLGIGGPSGGPSTRDYVGLTLEQAEQRANGTNNDVIRIAGRDGTCVGIVRDHVINRVNIYLENGIVAASKSF